MPLSTDPNRLAPPSHPMNAEMNVTPMLDVLLVLLIIFMAGLMALGTMDAHLPDPEARGEADAVPIVLEVGARRHYAINRQVVPADSLAPRLRALYLTRPDKRIILEGARDATYQEIIRAMDIARGAGVVIIGVGMRDSAARAASGGQLPR